MFNSKTGNVVFGSRTQRIQVHLTTTDVHQAYFTMYRLMHFILKSYGLELTSLMDLISPMHSLIERKILQEDYRCKKDSDVDHMHSVNKNGIFMTGPVSHTLNMVFNVVRKGPPGPMSKENWYCYRCIKCGLAFTDTNVDSHEEKYEF